MLQTFSQQQHEEVEPMDLCLLRHRVFYLCSQYNQVRKYDKKSEVYDELESLITSLEKVQEVPKDATTNLDALKKKVSLWMDLEELKKKFDIQEVELNKIQQFDPFLEQIRQEQTKALEKIEELLQSGSSPKEAEAAKLLIKAQVRSRDIQILFDDVWYQNSSEAQTSLHFTGHY
eukprot:GHVP01003936.1.p1 GENE.GHVP01003936.1~~GHVP01003936.1.p1  ORF type:complete len:175 (-),score=31.38 GHVP01003936.1:344-868(-)